MPLMGSFYVGTSGLQTSQNALNTTGHNLANIDTAYYSRQQVLQGNRVYNPAGYSYVCAQQVGLGVSYTEVRQVRDYFLDQTYRKEAGRSAFYSNNYTAVNEMETLFGEMEGVEFQTALGDLWTTVQELAKDPSSATNQGLLISKSANFLERAQAVYSGLCSYQDNVNEQIKDQVDQINDYGDKIYELNGMISRAEASNAENANDLRDARNQLLDELSALVKISYSEDGWGKVSVNVEGVSFVSESYVNKLGCEEDTETGFYTPIWKYDKDTAGNYVKLYDTTEEISSDADTDIGGLKALVLERGDHRGTYMDIPHREDFPTEQDYNDAVEKYNNEISSSLIVNVMAEFDQLVKGVVTGMNEILNPRTTDAAGNVTTNGYDLFLRLGLDDIDPVNSTISSTWYTTDNLKINPDLLKQSSLLGATRNPAGSGFVTPDKKTDYTKSDALKALFANDFSTLNPNINTAANFAGYYTNLIGQIANSGSVYKGMTDNQEATVKEVESARQQVVGVSDNEELTNMIKYQNAYNASSRYINAVNEMLGHLIEKLG